MDRYSLTIFHFSSETKGMLFATDAHTVILAVLYSCYLGGAVG